MKGHQVEAFQASVKRCLESTAFLKDFYDRFMASSPEIKAKFKGTDFDRQFRMMADSLFAMAVAIQGGPDNMARRDMKRLASRHGEMRITPQMYDTWLDCLIQAAWKHDPLFSDVIEQAWRETMAPGIEYMRAGTPFEA